MRSWSKFDEAASEGIITLKDALRLFTGNFFQRRLDDDWLARYGEYFGEVLTTLDEIGKSGPFWKLT